MDTGKRKGNLSLEKGESFSINALGTYIRVIAAMNGEVIVHCLRTTDNTWVPLVPKE